MANRSPEQTVDQTQDIELPGDSKIQILSDPSDATADAADAPSVKTSRRRGNMISPPPQGMLNVSPPPPFSGILQLEPKNLKEFQKALKKHSKCSQMKKLVCLDYFASRFTEICYFEVQPNGAGLSGVLGYGNVTLVTQIQNQMITESVLPSIFGVLAEESENKIFTGPIEGLRGEDQQGLTQLGYQVTQFIGAFPVTYKKAVTGLWVCTAPDFQEFTTKEIAALRKQFTNFVF